MTVPLCQAFLPKSILGKDFTFKATHSMEDVLLESCSSFSYSSTLFQVLNPSSDCPAQDSESTANYNPDSQDIWTERPVLVFVVLRTAWYFFKNTAFRVAQTCLLLESLLITPGERPHREQGSELHIESLQCHSDTNDILSPVGSDVEPSRQLGHGALNLRTQVSALLLLKPSTGTWRSPVSQQLQIGGSSLVATVPILFRTT